MPDAHAPPDFSHVKPLLLGMTQERSTRGVLQLVASRLAAARNIALARVWLVDADEPCALCRTSRGAVPPPGTLHPVTIELNPHLDDPRGRALADFEHLPPGELPYSPELVLNLEREDGWAWARELGLRGLARQPLLHRDELLGLIEVFTWPLVAPEGPAWLRVIADHAAAGIANARAYEEIQLLRRRLAEENENLEAEIRELQSFGRVVGRSPALSHVLDQVELVAPLDSTVLVLGESGTGKELIAREVHDRSRRSDAPLIRVNCASIPSGLYESEFFGHVRGAFTGAVGDRQGRFELADGGTIFLDEVGELPLDMQAKLLRVLQEGQYERVGDGRTRTTDVRIIAATNRDLKQEAEAGRFRSDLYYRLNVFPIQLPPLRERAEDIPLLAKHFVDSVGARMGRADLRLTKRAVATLRAYPWPGNVRELHNVVERAAILARDGVLRFDLPGAAAQVAAAAHASGSSVGADDLLSDREVRDLERANLLRALERTGGRVSGPEGAAALLRMKPSTLASRVRRLGLRSGLRA
ncbi:MAG: sigma 54-interacting transcriptional regulator [Planctomycetota bacterium]